MSVADNNKRIAKNTSFLYVRLILVMCINLYVSRVILQNLGATDYGLYNVIGGLVIMFTALNGSLGSSSSRFFTVELARNDERQLNKVFNTAIAIHVTMALIVFILAETVGLWYLCNKMVVPPDRIQASMYVYQFSLLASMFTITQVPYNAAVIAHEQMDIFAYVGMVEAVGKLLIAYLISFSPIDKLIFYASLLLAMNISILVFYRIYCSRHFKETKLHFQRDGRLYKSMLSYAMYDTIGCMSSIAQGQGLNMVLNLFCGPMVNAARAIAYQVQSSVTQFATNFLTAVNPQIIKYYVQHQYEAMMNLVHRASIYALVILWMLICPLSLEIDYVLSIWLGDVPSYTASFIVIVLVNEMLNAFRRPRITIFHATGHIKMSNVVTGGILCLALPLGYILMKLGYSPNSVFYGMLTTTIISDFTNLLILKRYLKYSIIEFWRDVHLRCIICVVLIGIIPYWVHCNMAPSFLRLTLVSLSSLFSTILVVWTYVMSIAERDKLKGIIQGKIHGKKAFK